MTDGPSAGWSVSAGNSAMARPVFASPKRSLGQNFLVDPNICRRVVAGVGLAAGDPVLEIGPGRGALTRILAAHSGPVLALEKDRDLAAWLKTEYPGVAVIHADGLEFCWEATDRMPGLSLVGNLPYNVASPMIWEMVSRCRAFRSMTFMVQKEVAERLAATAGSRVYGALSAWVGNFVRAEILFVVPPQVFRPRPKVDSAVVRFTPIPDPAWTEADALSSCLRTLFQQRRKQLGTILKTRWSDAIGDWCRTAGVDRRIRPEDLSPGMLRTLSVLLDERP